MSLASLRGQEPQLKAMKAEGPKAEAPMATQIFEVQALFEKDLPPFYEVKFIAGGAILRDTICTDVETKLKSVKDFKSGEDFKTEFYMDPVTEMVTCFLVY